MRRYPDPDRVPYPSTLPPRFPCQITTQDAGKSYPMHAHGAWIDKGGNGNTDVTAAHFHRVRGFVVMPDESDGHTHELTMLPCGAGGPQTTAQRGPAEMMSLGAGDVAPSVVLQPAQRPGTGLYIIGAVIAVAMVAAGAFFLLRGDE